MLCCLVGDLQPHEPWCVTTSDDLESVASQSRLQRGHYPCDGVAGRGEVVEVPRGSVHEALHDQRGTAGKREVIGCGQPGHETCDPSLELVEHRDLRRPGFRAA